MQLLVELFLVLFSKRSSVFIKYAAVVKENEILKRNLELKGHRISFTDSHRRFFYFILKLFPGAKRILTIVKPETILNKWKEFSGRRWFF